LQGIDTRLDSRTPRSPGHATGEACCIWLTGLSGAGKSTVSVALQEALSGREIRPAVLDGDVIRRGLNRDLGFSAADRDENIRRIGEVAWLMVDASLFVIVAFISPFRAQRDRVRALFEPGQFVEVFVDTPLAECERRDVKGLYAAARSGLVKDFTGIDSPYEPPLAPEVHLQTTRCTPQEAAAQVLEWLDRRP